MSPLRGRNRKVMDIEWRVRRSEIAKRYLLGYSLSETAKLFGISKARVHQVVLREAPGAMRLPGAGGRI